MKDPNQLLRINEVSQFTSLAQSTINLWVAQRKFPEPIVLSATIKVWQVKQLLDWIEGHANTKNSMEVGNETH